MVAMAGKKRSSLASPPPAKKKAAEAEAIEADGGAAPGTPTSGYTLKEEKEIIAFAKRLAANDKQQRDQAIKRLEQWMAKHKALAEADLLKIWKGLFYCMWMADKAQAQEALATSISRLVHCFGDDLARARLFVCAFYRTVRREWTGLDQHRLDKFYAFMRTMLRECLRFAQRRQWSPAALAAVVLPLEPEVLAHPWPNGLRLHLCDLALPELARVSKAKGGVPVDTEQAVRVLRPFLAAAASCEDKVVAERARARVLLDFVEGRQGEEGEAFLPGVEAEELQAMVFDLAAGQGTRDRYRPALYEAHKAFQGLTGKRRAGDGVPSHVGLVFGQDKASAAAAAKLTAAQQKEAAAAAALAAKEEEKERKEQAAKAAKAEKQGKGEKRKATPVEEAQQEGGKKKGSSSSKKEAAGSSNGKLETPLGEVEGLAGLSKAQKKKMKKLLPPKDEAADGKQSQQLQQSQQAEPPSKKKRTEQAQTKTGSAAAAPTPAAAKTSKAKAPAAAPAAEAEAPKKRKLEKPAAAAPVVETKKAKKAPAAEPAAAEFIASKKFAGPKPGYAFKKGAKGVGYYLDAKQQQQGGTGKGKKGAAAAAGGSKPAGAPAAAKEKAADFIPAKKFAGGKSGYAFKKGPKGVGYYLDPVQNGGGAKAGGVGQQQKKVRFGKVHVKLFNKHGAPAGAKKGARAASTKGTVSFMGNGAGAGGKKGGNNRRKAVSYF